MYAVAMGKTITAVFPCLSAIPVNGFFALPLGRFLLVPFLYLMQVFEYALSFRRSALLFSGGWQFPAGLAFPFGEVTVILFHNALHFSECLHKRLHIGIAVLLQNIGQLIQLCGDDFISWAANNLFKILDDKNSFYLWLGIIAAAVLALYTASMFLSFLLSKKDAVRFADSETE